MNKQTLINNIKQQFLIKRLRAQEDSENIIENLKKDKEFNNLYSNYTQKQIDLMKTDLNDEINKLNQDIEYLKGQINNILSRSGLDISKLSPKFECEKCKDTGFVGNKLCTCLEKEINKQMSLISSSQTHFKSFNDCNCEIMNDNDIKTKNLLTEWVNKYPNVTKININILGKPGCGKTFFLECLANSLIEKNYNICYKTAFDLNEICRLYHCGQSYELSDIMKADILLIDDLGSEPILRNVTKEYLYNIINQRQVNHLPTIITSNLNLNDILNKYDERIFSRLSNKNLSLNIQLDSQDKRIN